MQIGKVIRLDVHTLPIAGAVTPTREPAKFVAGVHPLPLRPYPTWWGAEPRA